MSVDGAQSRALPAELTWQAVLLVAVRCCVKSKPCVAAPVTLRQLLLSPSHCLLVDDATLRLHARPLYGQAECVAVGVLGELDVFLIPAAGVYACVCVEQAKQAAALAVGALCARVWAGRRASGASCGGRQRPRGCKHAHTAASCCYDTTYLFHVSGQVCSTLYLPLKRLKPIGSAAKGKLLLMKFVQLLSASPEFCHMLMATPLWNTSAFCCNRVLPLVLGWASCPLTACRCSCCCWASRGSASVPACLADWDLVKVMICDEIYSLLGINKHSSTAADQSAKGETESNRGGMRAIKAQ